MIRNLFKTTYRLLIQHKSFAFINVVGLTLALACCLLTFLWIQHQQRIDNFHRNNDRLYAAYQTVTTGNQVEGSYRTPMRFNAEQNARFFLIDEAKEAVPEIQSVVFYATGYELPWGHPETLEANGKKIKLNGSRASEDFFEVLNYPLISGDAKTALDGTRNIAISQKTAEAYFGSAQAAMNQTFRYENRLDFIVSAVFKDVPESSSLTFDFLLSWEAHNTVLESASPDFNTYVLLKEGADATAAAQKINAFVKPHLNSENDTKTLIGLQPLADRYLYGSFVNGKPAGGRITYVHIFASGAIFILLIACINFALIATARAIKRSKEIGIRKVLGTSRKLLVAQFYMEASFLTIAALLLALGIVALLVPFFGQLTGTTLSFPLGQWHFWGMIIVLALLTILLAGSYPAFILSSLKPIKALKQQQLFSLKRGTLRQGLVVFQFGLSVLFIVATFTIYRQTHYIQTLQLGYDRENLLYFRIEGELMEQRNYDLFKQLAADVPGVRMVDRSSETPHAMRFLVDIPDGTSNTTSGDDAINWEGKQHRVSTGFKPVSVGYDFVQLMGLEIVEGRDFSRTISTDSASAFLVNEEAVRQMGMNAPLGKWVSAWNKRGYIIGVLKDYHTYSLHEPIKPLIVDVKEYEYFGVVLVRIEAGKTEQALAGLAQLYTKINPKFPFDYQFVDTEYQSFYNNEQLMAKLVNIFTLLAIIISCLGLLGLVVFAVEQRTKEIGIRKVLGASVPDIVTMLSKDFVKLVVIAIVIASPLGWWAMNRWLEGFAYHIDIQWWMFAVAGLAAVTIALLTVSWQAIRAAVANPVASLRDE